MMKNSLWYFFKLMLVTIFMSNTLFAVHVFEESNFQGADDKKLAELIKSNPKAVIRHLYGIPYGVVFKKESSQNIIIWAIRHDKCESLKKILEIAKKPHTGVIGGKVAPRSVADILKYQEPSTGNTALHYAALDVVDAEKKTDMLLAQIPEEEKSFFINEITNNNNQSVWDVATQYSKPSLKNFALSQEEFDGAVKSKLTDLITSFEALKVKLRELQESLVGLKEKLEL